MMNPDHQLITNTYQNNLSKSRERNYQTIENLKSTDLIDLKAGELEKEKEGICKGKLFDDIVSPISKEMFFNFKN